MPTLMRNSGLPFRLSAAALILLAMAAGCSDEADTNRDGVDTSDSRDATDETRIGDLDDVSDAGDSDADSPDDGDSPDDPDEASDGDIVGDIDGDETGDVVDPECELGQWRYTTGGACLPADPCRDDTVCGTEHRICLNELGVSTCGRCLDGWTGGETGACTEAVQDDYVGRFRVGQDYFWIWTGERYERIYVRGVIMSKAIPGSGRPGPSITRDHYARWLAILAESGVNVIRVYSLHKLGLYEALEEHNRTNPDTPIYLFQGVYLPDTDEEDGDLLAVSEAFDASGERTVRAMHGTDETYNVDVSQWVLGWIIGREVFASEILATDAANPDNTSYEGETMRLTSGSPSEVWLTERLDRLVVYEEATFDESRPVAFSNWMELDPLPHPTESENSKKNLTEVDLSDIDTFGAPAGHFISYHVYPYYPKFISEDPLYRAHVDEHGPNAYRGVLLRLRDYYRDLPMIVAEYGVPSSWGSAQPSYSGMHHGGLTEREQGEALARMTLDIYETRYAGGVAFQWQDGWWKPTWITNRLTFPSDRYTIWHDLTTPQQSYGLLAFDPPPVTWEEAIDSYDATDAIDRIRIAADAAALHVRIDFVETIDSPQLVVGFDTYRDDLGDSLLPDGTATSIRSELVLEVDGSSAQMRVIDEYDLYRIRPWTGSYQSVSRDGGGWAPLLWQMTSDHTSGDGLWFFEGQDFEVGRLTVRSPGDDPTSQDAVVVGERSIELTLPWVLLQYADPSTMTVVHDDPETTGEIDGIVSEGIRLAVAYDGEVIETERYDWPTWELAPTTTERLKVSATLFFEALETIQD